MGEAFTEWIRNAVNCSLLSSSIGSCDPHNFPCYSVGVHVIIITLDPLLHLEILTYL